MWQDWVIASVQVVLAFSLLSSIFHSAHKPTLSTCIFTAMGLFTLSFVYITLALWFSALMSAIIGILWAVLGLQRHRLNKRGRT
ncbi:hypothetical protein A2853_02295 [Candidatus Kaiserbacteria bacterium RIFCSPHIGHO2_01_FULL_55_17]|uniref:Uncharacterized protein n=1 Tax=Candidatus Kaiserbacteria bacterium RIFCSPHIGHO2_01_FULL_55_17 TaxID=1798484 RepID=A0A1F6D7D5_9BACT|nr:MAG: hypothetical protein A2853_02295 [Candidatus Kaiserbacteria bacterium RIFCSPHIGHO2_01_FULL_55_17]